MASKRHMPQGNVSKGSSPPPHMEAKERVMHKPQLPMFQSPALQDQFQSLLKKENLAPPPPHHHHLLLLPLLLKYML